MEKADNDANGHGSEESRIDGLDTEHVGYAVVLDRFLVLEVDTPGGEVEVHREVHGGEADETRERGHPLVLPGEAERNRHREEDGQEREGDQSRVGHPGEYEVEALGLQEGQAVGDGLAGERGADAQHDAAEREQGHREHERLAESLEEFPERGFGLLHVFRTFEHGGTDPGARRGDAWTHG